MLLFRNEAILVAAPSKACVRGHSPAGIASSNPAVRMKVRLFWELRAVSCQVESLDGPIPPPEESYRLRVCVCVCVCVCVYCAIECDQVQE